MALETFPNLSSILIYFTTLPCDILNKTLNPTLQQREQPLLNAETLSVGLRCQRHILASGYSYCHKMGFNTVFARHRLCTSRSVINIRLDVANIIITFSVSTSHERSSHPFLFTAMTLADGLVIGI